MRKYLTDTMVKTMAPPKTGRTETFDAHEDEDGMASDLMLRITPNGVRTFVWRSRIKGAPRITGRDGKVRAADPVTITLGDATALKLGDARERARAMSKLARAGKDPREEAKAEAARAEEVAAKLEWSAVVSDFMEKWAKKRSSWKDTDAVFKLYATPVLKGKLLPEITRADVAKVLDKAGAVSPYRADRTLAAVRKLFNWARTRGLVEHTPIVPGMVDREGIVSRDRFLSFAEIRAVWLAADKIGQPFGPLVKMLLLAGQREGETAGARWAGMDLETERLWSLSPDETKNGRAQFVPLADTAIALLTNQPHVSDTFVFSTTGKTPVSGFSKAKAQLDAEIAAAGTNMAPWRFHDLRRTVATHMENALGISRDHVKLVLNHTDSSVTARYSRGEMLYARRRALVAWSRLLSLIVEGGKRWGRVARVLAPETEAASATTAEFRRAIQADGDTWAAHLKALAVSEPEAQEAA